MNDRALRYFLAVIRAGSIRGAAEALNLAASAVSRQVAELEAECGVALLERLPRGIRPTEAGRIVTAHALRQAEDSALLAESLQRLRGMRQGRVRLHCGDGFLPDLMENGLAAFAEAHPGLSFQVALGTTDAILAALAEGEAELGLAYNPPAHPALRSLALSRQPLAAILPAAHPLAGDPRPLRDFASLPAALLPPDHGVRRLLGRVEADGGFRLPPRLESASFEMHRRFVLAGLGVAFLPRFAAAREITDGTLVAVPLADPILAEASAHLLARASGRLPEAAERMADWLIAHLRALR
ncbi:LysR family transcriptional regulator [Pararoseomonas baculiformis]|nr:LysR family transcriptional regulator [Pararoseomonas baculiformis]